MFLCTLVVLYYKLSEMQTGNGINRLKLYLMFKLNMFECHWWIILSKFFNVKQGFKVSSDSLFNFFLVKSIIFKSSTCF